MEQNLNLILAIKERNLDRLNELINLGANVKTFLYENMSPLVYTLLNMRPTETGTIDDILSRLIDAGADVNSMQEYSYRTATMLAMVKNRSDEIVLRFINGGTNVHQICRTGQTTLIYAINSKCGKTVIRALIDKGSNINKGPMIPLSPLYCAVCFRNDPDIIEMLLIEGAVINPLEFRQSLLALCCKKRCKVDDNCRFKRVTDILIRRGVDIKQIQFDGNTIIHQATCNYVYALAQKHGISVDKLNHNNFTPLLQSLLTHKGHKVNDLLLIGADPNWRDSQGRSYLHFSTLIKTESYIDLLLYHGADLLVTNNAGQTAIDFSFSERGMFLNWSILGLKSLVQHYLLYVNEDGLTDTIQGLNIANRILQCSQYIDMCRSELSGMRDTLLKDGLSIYQFCRLKRFYSSVCVPIHIDQYLIKHDNISENFRIYKDIIFIRLKHNSRNNFKHLLLGMLEQIVIGVTSPVDGGDAGCLLNYDCLYLIGRKYLNYTHLCALILASFDH